MSFKTTVNWLFIDIWRYLVIGCFDLKIGVVQHTIVRVYSSVIRQKGESQDGCFKSRGKETFAFWKTWYAFFLETPVLRFALFAFLPTYYILNYFCKGSMNFPDYITMSTSVISRTLNFRKINKYNADMIAKQCIGG